MYAILLCSPWPQVLRAVLNRNKKPQKKNAFRYEPEPECVLFDFYDWKRTKRKHYDCK